MVLINLTKRDKYVIDECVDCAIGNNMFIGDEPEIKSLLKKLKNIK